MVYLTILAAVLRIQQKKKMKYFNQEYLQNNLTPNHAKIKINKPTPAPNLTQKKEHNLRIK